MTDLFRGVSRGLRPVVLIVAVALSVAPLAHALDREDAWVEDLRFLEEELEIRHVELFRSLDEAEWHRGIERLVQRVDGSSDAEILVGIARLLARVEDGHTGLYLDNQAGFERVYPVEFYPVREGLLVLAAAKEYEELIGGVVQTIAGRPFEDLALAIDDLVASDNEHGRLDEVLDYIVVPELLATVGLVDDAESLPIHVRHPDGRELTALVEPVADEDSAELRLLVPPSGVPLWLARRDVPYWFETLGPGGDVYVQFNSADISRGQGEADFEAFCDRLVEAVQTSGARRLILDLRWNDGGSYWRTRHLLNAAIRADRINREGGLFALIGPFTFSAAVMHALRLQEYTDVTFVGAPTGGVPNHTGTSRRLRLPNSGAIVKYSAIFKQPASDVDHRPFIAPDLWAELTAGDYRAGRDPVLEMARRPVEPEEIAPVLRAWLDRMDPSSAIERYREETTADRNRYRVSERRLNTLGYELLREERFDAAVAVMEVYASEYPWSANAFDSLGDAYQGAGRVSDAIRAYERAFTLDRRFGGVRDRIRELEGD